jgi:hypothetical protein
LFLLLSMPAAEDNKGAAVAVADIAAAAGACEIVCCTIKAALLAAPPRILGSVGR